MNKAKLFRNFTFYRCTDTLSDPVIFVKNSGLLCNHGASIVQTVLHYITIQQFLYFLGLVASENVRNIFWLILRLKNYLFKKIYILANVLGQA